MGTQFNNEGKQGWRFAADAARITDERAGSEDRKHTSGVFFVQGNEGMIAQTWINVRGGMRVFAVFFWPFRRMDGRRQKKR